MKPEQLPMSSSEEVREKENAENIEGNLTSQDIEDSIKSGKPIEVKVQRSSGEIEKGWIVTGSDGKDAIVVKTVEGGKFIRKVVSLDELKQWNMSTTENGNEISTEGNGENL